MIIFRYIGKLVKLIGWLAIALVVIFISFRAMAGERCTLGVCEGERVIIYDARHRRIGTIEHQKFRTKPLQLRDTQNRIVGYIGRGGATYDASHRRTGRVVTSGDTVGKHWK